MRLVFLSMLTGCTLVGGGWGGYAAYDANRTAERDREATEECVRKQEREDCPKPPPAAHRSVAGSAVGGALVGFTIDLAVAMVVLSSVGRGNTH